MLVTWLRSWRCAASCPETVSGCILLVPLIPVFFFFYISHWQNKWLYSCFIDGVLMKESSTNHGDKYICVCCGCFTMKAIHPCYSTKQWVCIGSNLQQPLYGCGRVNIQQQVWHQWDKIKEEGWITLLPYVLCAYACVCDPVWTARPHQETDRKGQLWKQIIIITHICISCCSNLYWPW